MHCYRINIQSIKLRLDPQYYFHLSSFALLPSKFPLVKLGELMKEKPQYGANETAIDGDPLRDIRYIRITDIDELGNLKKDTWKTTKNIDLKYLLEENDILFARSGATAGKCFVYKYDHEKAIFAGYLIRFKFDQKKVIPKYIFYLTQMKKYQLWVKTIQRPAGQPNINSDEFKSLEIPLPPLALQNWIVQILDNSYKCRNECKIQAKNCFNSVDEFLINLLNLNSLKLQEKKGYLMHLTDVKYRLDPSAYHPNRMSAINAIKKFQGKIKPLNQIVNFRKELIKESVQKYRYVGLENIESNTGKHIFSEENKDSFDSALRFYVGDILFPKLRPYLNKVYLAEFDGVCSTEFYVLQVKECRNTYLATFLRSKLVLNQTSYLMTGNILPRLQTRDVENLLIPIPDDNYQLRIEQEVYHRMKLAENLIKQGEDAINVAYEKIEKIILEGIDNGS